MKKIELYKIFLNSKRPIQKSILSRIENTLRNDFIYNSNAIEGNSLTRQETEVILEYGVTVKGKPLKDHLEVKGQEYAINFLNNIIKENEVLSLRLIKEFHALILGPVDPEIAGQFKKFKNKIVGSSFETSHPIFVEEDLEKIAGGRVWLGSQAKENGLVDELGTLNDCIDSLAKELELKDFKLAYIRGRQSIAEIVSAMKPQFIKSDIVEKIEMLKSYSNKILYYDESLENL